MGSMLAIAPARLGHVLTEEQPAVHHSTAPALKYFESASFEEATAPAHALYASAEHCPRCRSLLAHRFERLGSSLFRDEDPRSLARAFDSADRDGCSVRLLAACIVLFGRERVPLH
jgi:hypothetical protein